MNFQKENGLATYEQINLEAIKALPDDFPNKRQLLRHWKTNGIEQSGMELPDKYAEKLRQLVKEKWERYDEARQPEVPEGGQTR